MPTTSLTFEVGYIDGGEITVTAHLGELVQFERHYNLPMTVLMDPTERRLEHMLYVAWCAAKRGGETREFDDWFPNVVSIGTAVEDDADPLDPSQSTGS